MSQILIQQYLNELSDLRRVSGSARESVVREAFKTLLKDWGRSQDLIFVPEHEHTTLTKSRVYLDGALLHELRVPLGYWEAKDEEDDLDKEIHHEKPARSCRPRQSSRNSGDDEAAGDGAQLVREAMRLDQAAPSNVGAGIGMTKFPDGKFDARSDYPGKLRIE
jgi:hypothetical protein